MKLFLVEFGIGVANIKKYILAEDEADLYQHREITNYFNRKVTRLATLGRNDSNPLIDLRKARKEGEM